ncbi:MAG: cellulose-binding domain-containing protein, partial [Lachnospiraceae bacterium]|nr:cellulose-binding domain-containing protein [Lachnospiraceae bacterium]
GQSSDGGSSAEMSLDDYKAYYKDVIKSADGMTINIDNGWNNGSVNLSMAITINNTSGSNITTWERKLVFKDGVTLEKVGGWCANFKISGNTVTITPESYNGSINAGGSVGGIGLQIKVTE